MHEGVEEGERGDCLVRGAATIYVGVTAAHTLRYCQALRSSLGRGFVLCKGNVRAVGVGKGKYEDGCGDNFVVSIFLILVRDTQSQPRPKTTRTRTLSESIWVPP